MNSSSLPSVSHGASFVQAQARSQGLTFKIAEGKVKPDIHTLQDHYDAGKMGHRVDGMLKTMGEAARLVHRDNDGDDLDDRAGHVVLPAWNFEAHTKRKQTSFQQTLEGGETIQGNPSEITFLAPKKSGNAGDLLVWNLENSTATYHPGRVSTVASEPKNVLADRTFGVNSKGKVARPGATSLAEAKQLEGERELASRAQKIIDSALHWEAKIGEQEVWPNTGVQDLAPAANEAVFSGVAFPDWRDRDGLTTSDEAFVFDLEKTDRGLFVTNNTYLPKDTRESHQRWTVLTPDAEAIEPGPIQLRTEKDSSVVKITFRSEAHGPSEQVDWDKANGTARYRRFES